MLKIIVGWIATIILWLWATLPKALDLVGRTTLPEDWGQLMAERLPEWSAWLFSTPWWVPTLLATALTVWLMWASLPRQKTIKETRIMRHFENKNIPHAVRDIGTEQECEIHRHSDGRVTFRFPYRLRCAPTLFRDWEDGIEVLEITQDHVTFSRNGAISFIYDALDKTQVQKLCGVFGIKTDEFSNFLIKFLREKGFDSMVDEYNQLASNP